MPGLNSILNCLSRVENMERKLDGGSYVQNTLREHQYDLVRMNVDQLYDSGVNSLGVDISSYAPYAPYTVRLKREKGQPFNRVTLRDTGAFHRSFRVVFDISEFYFTATDPKTQELVDKYGGNIFGLTPENRNKIAIEWVKPGVLEQMKKELFN